jgi:hypothetical protein
MFKFKSKACGDLILLQTHGRQLLDVLGKEASAQGIVTVAQMPDAIAALQAAIEREAAARAQAIADARARHEPEPKFDPITLKHRALPFIDMLRRSHAAQADITWGV